MKIRTITFGLPGLPTPDEVCRAGRQLNRAVEHFQLRGYTVQSRRVAFAHWDRALASLADSERSSLLHAVDLACADAKIDFCSVGVARAPGQIEHMAEILAQSARLNGSAEIVSAQRPIEKDVVSAAARAVPGVQRLGG